ncbi:MAG: hypothetical protein K6T65_12235 [Peptococcaceae bacterium]|nr:hypothetical protein [Peptococcaceae bacterium]
MEVPVRLRDGRPEVNGLPVIVSSGAGRGEVAEPRFNETAPPEFVALRIYIQVQPGRGSCLVKDISAAVIAPVPGAGSTFVAMGEREGCCLEAADRALYRAKAEGRNRILSAGELKTTALSLAANRDNM